MRMTKNDENKQKAKRVKLKRDLEVTRISLSSRVLEVLSTSNSRNLIREDQLMKISLPRSEVTIYRNMGRFVTVE